MRVAAVVVKQRTILATIMNDTDAANLNTSRATRAAAWVTSHDSKHTKKNRERGKNRVEFTCSLAVATRVAHEDKPPFIQGETYAQP